jgi:hypothetical protein
MKRLRPGQTVINGKLVKPPPLYDLRTSAFARGIDMAQQIVKEHMRLETCGEPDCETCPVLRRRRVRILRALTCARRAALQGKE